MGDLVAAILENPICLDTAPGRIFRKKVLVGLPGGKLLVYTEARVP